MTGMFWIFRPFAAATTGGTGATDRARRRRYARSLSRSWPLSLGLAAGLLLAMAGVAVAYGVSELRESVGSSTLPPAWASERKPLDREWRTLRKPYTFDHMFRQKR